MGSGTTAISAKKLKRNFIGIDISKEYCKLSTERLKEFEKTGIDPFLEIKKKKVKLKKDNYTLPLFESQDL